MRTASAGMLILLALFNEQQSGGNVSPTIPGGGYTYMVNTTVGVNASRSTEDVSKISQPRLGTRPKDVVALEADVGMGNSSLAEDS